MASVGCGGLTDKDAATTTKNTGSQEPSGQEPSGQEPSASEVPVPASAEKVYPDCSGGSVVLSELNSDFRWTVAMASGNQAVYVLTSHSKKASSIFVVDKLGAPEEPKELLLDEWLRQVSCLAISEDSIYVGDLEGLYRMPKEGGPLEPVHEVSVPPPVDTQGFGCALRITEGRLFYQDPEHKLWRIEDEENVLLAEDVFQFRTNDRSLFWKNGDGVLLVSDFAGSAVSSRSDTEGALLHVSAEFLYFSGTGSIVHRLPIIGGEMELALDSIDYRVGGDVRSTVFFEDELYLSSDLGQLLHASLGQELPAAYEFRDELGSFDDDDFDSAMTVDEAAVYWLAGTTLGVRSSDNDPVALIATCH